MPHLIVVGCGVAVVHALLVQLLRRAQRRHRQPAWLHVAWVASLAVVAAAAIWRMPIPTDIAGALGVLWVVVALDLFVLLGALVLLDDQHRIPAATDQGGKISPDRRRLLVGVIATGTATAAWGFGGHRDAAAIAPESEGMAMAQIDPLANGARGDYTGRFGTPGSGTDSRAGIQAALDAASDLAGADYFDYVTRRSTVVTLPPGHYLISAPAQDASLAVPPGVVLDASAATLYFDYPAHARASWSGIRIGQAGQLRLGKLYPSGRSAPPDAELVYDAVRLVQTDDNSRVMGYGDSVIGGWQGAAIRGIGAWLVYVQGLRITDNAYGYVASRTGDGTLGYAVSQVDGADERNHADVRFQDCYFVKLTHGGIVGSVEGRSRALLAADYESLNLTVGLLGCAFEGIPGYALNITSAMIVSAWDCAFEDVGAASGGMIRLDNCRSASFASTRVNLAAPRGEVQRPVSRYVFEVAATDSLVVDGMHVFNRLNPTLQLADAEPRRSWRVCNVSAGRDLAPGPMFAGDGEFAMSGGWNKGHLVLGAHHLWIDGAGGLRHKDGSPGFEMDGEAIS